MLLSILKFICSFIISFTTQISVGEFLLLYGTKHRTHFKLRALCYLPFMLLPVVFKSITGNVFFQLPFFYIGWFSYAFLFLLVVSLFISYFCFDAPFDLILFYSISAHIIQHAIYMLTCIVTAVFPVISDGSLAKSICDSVIIVSGWTFTYFVLIRPITSKRTPVHNLSLITFSVMSLIIINVLNWWAWNFDMQTLATFIFQFLCSVFLLMIQYDLFDRSKRIAQNTAMEHLYSEALHQQQLSRENIDIINRKCHDMKHQLARLRNSNQSAATDADFAELEKAIDLYDGMVHTGNEIFDTLLAEKYLLCEKNQIKFTYVIDGQKLNFLDPADLYSLFGNALDNAMESLMAEEPENRIMTLKIAERLGFLSISLDNYCSRDVVFSDGLPVTNKADTNYHGFGTQSMRFIVNKYSGSLHMSMDSAAHRFMLRMVFPQHNS